MGRVEKGAIMRTLICFLALSLVLIETPTSAQSSRRGGSGILTPPSSGGSSGLRHGGGSGRSRGGGFRHCPQPGWWGGAIGGWNGLGWGGFGFGGNVFYGATYQSTIFPHSIGGFGWGDSMFFPPYYQGGFIQQGTEAPITYLPMRGTAAANRQPMANPATANGAANLVPDRNQLEPLELVDRPVRRSSLENRLKARQELIRGDMAFREQNRLKANGHYRQALSYAEDLPETRFRLAVSYATIGKFELAVEHLKQLLELDPHWPEQGETLAELYGEDNVIARNSLVLRLSQWVGEDIRDPDRLLLLGAFLFESSPEKAREFLRSSAQFSGSDRYAALFTRPVLRTTSARATEESPLPDDQFLDALVPEPPASSDSAAPSQRTIPVPPLPEPESADPEDSPDSAEAGERFAPPNFSFTHPRHGGGRHTATVRVAAQGGPTLPPLGN
jgi:hypothetical protein